MITIVADEKDIEDFLCADLEKHLGLKFLQRQVRTPAGIIDVLAKGDEEDHYYVIELKKDEITPSTLAQALRYTMYLNAKKSKDGKRIFIPLLIGCGLHSEMEKSVTYFPRGGYDMESCLYSAYYRIFSFDPARGVTFDFHSVKQRDYEGEYLNDIEYGFFSRREQDTHQENYRLWDQNDELRKLINQQDNVVTFPAVSA